MVKITLIPKSEFDRVRGAAIDKYRKLSLLADMNRANALASVKRAGSGHLGSSFSSLDIVTFLYYAEMNTAAVGIRDPDRDVYFSSKGHDVPGFYAVQYGLGNLPKDQLCRLRRLGGTCGHPDVSTPGVEANSGSLGMGVSKAKGMALAKKFAGRKGRIFVMTGDGELQEGQIYEALQSAVHQKVANLNVIVDHNKVQTDKLVAQIIDLGDLEAKFRSFGWHVARCSGHDFRQLEKALAEFRTVSDKPKVLIADTIKGRGVSFMEHPAALKANNGLYRWHSGAPDDESFNAGHAEIVGRLNRQLKELGLAELALEDFPPDDKLPSGVTRQYVADAFGEALVEIGRKRKDLVVIDADLAADCRVRAFELEHPDRFIENGIAEQDMVSLAGGLALQGFLPVCNSFASFLASRANEQIYNNACENTRIIYACHYSGLIPAGPGQSHQSIRDISLFAALPNFVILQPCNMEETKMVVDYCVNQAKENCVIRLIIGPSPREIVLPDGYRLQEGKGAVLADGDRAVLFAYGPVMMHEALRAGEALGAKGFALKVVNMPWLNRIDAAWLRETVGACKAAYVLEDHAPVGGLGDAMLNCLFANGLADGMHFEKFAVEGFPAWGTPPEVLRFHRLDGPSLAERILAGRGER